MKKRWLSLVLCAVAVLAFSCTKEKKEFLQNCENENTHAYQLVFTKMSYFADIEIRNKITNYSETHRVEASKSMRDNYIVLSNDTMYHVSIYVFKNDKPRYTYVDTKIIEDFSINLYEPCQIVSTIKY